MAPRASAEAGGRAARRTLAVFDLDGTLTRGDTLGPYLLGFLATRPGRWLRLVRVFVPLLRFACGAADRDELKQSIIVVCLGGAQRAELARYTAGFVDRLVRTGLRAAGLEVIEGHRRRGDDLVLLSASPDLYVSAIAERLRFDRCVCTQLLWDSDKLVGRFVTANRRCEEKVRVLGELRRGGDDAIFAYANSRSDLAHLLSADRGVLVNGSVAARRAAARAGLPCASWR